MPKRSQPNRDCAKCWPETACGFVRPFMVYETLHDERDDHQRSDGQPSTRLFGFFARPSRIGRAPSLGWNPLRTRKRQHGFVRFQRVAAPGQKFPLAGQKFPGNLQLMLIAQAVEHEFFGDARKNFRAQGLMGAG